MKITLPHQFRPRLIMTTTGVILCAIAVGFFKCSLFGVDPFQCFAQGSWQRLMSHISYGTYYAGLSLLMLILDFFLDKHYIGIATFINMFLTGYIADFSQATISRLVPSPSLMVRVLMLLIAVVVMCFASSLYMTSDLGVSVYDAIPIIISNKKQKTVPLLPHRMRPDLRHRRYALRPAARARNTHHGLFHGTVDRVLQCEVFPAVTGSPEALRITASCSSLQSS